jgi:hypothetical protein
MDVIEFLLVVLVIIVIAFVIYYLMKGSTGKIDLARPLESRVDEYLDRRFEDLISEWSLVTRPLLGLFREQAARQLDHDERRVAALSDFEQKFAQDLAGLEARLDALEKEAGSAGK